MISFDLRTRPFVQLLALLLVGTLAPSVASATVLVQGRLRVLAGPPPYEQIDRTENTGTENSDSGSVSTISGATNTADYDISLDRGWLQTNIAGDNGEASSCDTYCPGSYSGLVHIDLYEGISFTVPAGTYTEGVTASLSGSILGSIHASAGEGGDSNRPNADAYFSVSFGPLFERSYEQVIGGDPTIYVNELFESVVQVVAPGTTYAEETIIAKHLDVHLDIVASMNTSSTALGASGVEYLARFDSLETSDAGVSWESESGVFLAEVPEPSTALLLGSSILTLAALRRRRLHAR